MRRFLFALSLVVLVPAQSEARVTKMVVERVVDGDTFVTRGGERVRLIGVDTPETVHPSVPDECYGAEASAFAERHLEGDRIGLEFDRDRRDRYGRLLAYVRDSDFDRQFGWVLIRRGYATAKFYSPNFRYRDYFLKAQQKAAAEDRGLWGRCR